MRPFTFLISGCGSAGRSVAQVLTQDGRGQVAALVDPQTHQRQEQQEHYPVPYWGPTPGRNRGVGFTFGFVCW